MTNEQMRQKFLFTLQLTGFYKDPSYNFDVVIFDVRNIPNLKKVNLFKILLDLGFANNKFCEYEDDPEIIKTIKSQMKYNYMNKPCLANYLYDTNFVYVDRKGCKEFSTLRTLVSIYECCLVEIPRYIFDYDIRELPIK